MLECVCVYTQQCFSVKELNLIKLRIKGNLGFLPTLFLLYSVVGSHQTVSLLD